LYGFLSLIKSAPNRESIAAAIKQWNALELEDVTAENGYVLALHRTFNEWAQHPEGQHLAKIPLIEIIKINETAPIPFKPNPEQPLSGIKHCPART